MPTGTDAVLHPQVQELIDRTISRTGTASGVGFGFMDAEDVRSHLQEAAVAAMCRYDCSQGEVIAFLRPRLRGAAIDLIRTRGSRTRRRLPSRDRPHRKPGGAQRPALVSLQREVEPDLMAEGDSNGQILRTANIALTDPLDAVAGVDELADLTLALWELPRRLRLVLYLLYYEELAPADVAVRLDISEEGMRALRDAALTKMRLALLRATDLTRRTDRL